MFNVERFVESCRGALREPTPHLAIKELVEEAVSAPSEVERALGPITQGGIQTLLRTEELTILHFVWAPLMTLGPHDHRMWAVIGLYEGQEDNSFFRRRKDAPGIERLNARSLQRTDAIALGEQVIHSVANPLRQYTGAIHVYGGDFFATQRNAWPSEEEDAQAWNPEQTLKLFAEANARAAEAMGHSDAGTPGGR